MGDSRYPTSEKLEIIRTVEGSHLPVKQTLDMLCIPRSTFYRWYDLYVDGGLDALADHSPRPGSVWNRIPDARRDDLIEFALEHEALSTRELAVKYTDEKRYFVSESSAYRILKAADLITAPDYVVIKAADEFTDKTTAINEMWQTDFTYFKIIGWGWYYLSTILDDYSRYIIAWKLCTNMRAEDVTNIIELALAASGCDQAVVRHKPRLLSDNGSCYISGDLVEWLEGQKMKHVRGAPFHPQTQGKIPLGTLLRNTLPGKGTLASDHEELCSAGKLLLARRSRTPDRGFCRVLQQPALPREPEQRHARRRLLRARQSHSQRKGKDQEEDNPPLGTLLRNTLPGSGQRRLQHQKQAA